jgi:hypothetical protein
MVKQSGLSLFHVATSSLGVDFGWPLTAYMTWQKTGKPIGKELVVIN